jgi:hypothetical protein
MYLRKALNVIRRYLLNIALVNLAGRDVSRCNQIAQPLRGEFVVLVVVRLHLLFHRRPQLMAEIVVALHLKRCASLRCTPRFPDASACLIK